LQTRTHPRDAAASADLRTAKVFGPLAAVAFAAACASTQHGASDANLAKAKSGAPDGFALFQQQCAGCHGARGESVSRAPRILGEGALPDYPSEHDLNADPAAGDPELLRLRAQTRPAGAPWRDPFRTADDLYRYVSKNMPLPAKQAGSLTSEQYWAVINFMLLAHGVPVPVEGVTTKNASSVKL
jgi:mono/diheme cytochrome c family protein